MKILNNFKNTVLLIFVFLCITAFVSAEEPEQKFKGFNLQGYKEDGEKAWDVNGDTADIEGTKVKLSNVVANSYGDQKVNVTAEEGTIDQANGNMHLERDVIITSQDGSQLVTDSLDWNRNEDTVTTEDDVLITDKRLTVTGTGMKAKPGLKNAKIEEDVTVVLDTEIEDSENDKVTITCDGPVTIDQIESVAEFVENVVAVQDYFPYCTFSTIIFRN